MEKFTNDEMQFLGQFEDNFTRAIDADYVRGAALSDLERMRTIYERVTGKDYHLNTGCGNCILKFFKTLGGAYRQQKAEVPSVKSPAKKPAPKKK